MSHAGYAAAIYIPPEYAIYLIGAICLVGAICPLRDVKMRNIYHIAFELSENISRNTRYYISHLFNKYIA